MASKQDWAKLGAAVLVGGAVGYVACKMMSKSTAPAGCVRGAGEMQDLLTLYPAPSRSSSVSRLTRPSGMMQDLFTLIPPSTEPATGFEGQTDAIDLLPGRSRAPRWDNQQFASNPQFVRVAERRFIR